VYYMVKYGVLATSFIYPCLHEAKNNLNSLTWYIIRLKGFEILRISEHSRDIRINLRELKKKYFI
ncbi:hypothetical protein, partial [Niallia sp. NCCP-28]|uniref:hypothetical protein n=1 Tax=Niallia sp. NCCP-28 TaxID=2934712 RepID=UPI0020C00ABC